MARAARGEGGRGGAGRGKRAASRAGRARVRDRGGRTVRRGRFLPFAFAPGGLDLELSDCRLDSTRPVVTSDGSTQFDLAELRFDTVSVLANVAVPGRCRDAVVPPDERADPPLAVAVVVECVPTCLRRAWVRPLPAHAEDAVEIAIELARGELRGVARVEAHLVRTRGRSEPARGYAARTGGKVASGRPWTLLVDRDRAPAGGYLDVRYQSFSEDPRLFPRSQNLYRLDCDSPNPVLWLNTDHEQVCRILDDRGTRGVTARTREVAFDLVAFGVWTRLVLAAAHAVDEDGSTPYPWQEGVLQRMLPLLYPEHSGRARRLEELRAERTAEGGALLLERLEAALQGDLKLADHLLALAREVA